MKPDQLIDRDVVKGILRITSESQFQELRREGLIPPAFGRFKREYFWSIGLIHEYKKLVDEKGVGFTKGLVTDACLVGLDRLIKTGSITINE